MSNTIAVERHSIECVPLAERHGKVWHLWAVWFSGDAHLATLATGAVAIAMGGNLAWTLVAVFGGCALGTLFMALHSAQGPQLGLPQMIQSRPQFGYRGALLVWLVALVTYVGFNAFNQVLAADTIQQLTGLPRLPSLFGFTLLALLLAIAGYRLIHLAQRALSWIMMAGLAVFTLLASLHLRLPAGQLSLAAADFRMVPFLTQFFAAASYQLAWSIYVSDYSRYLPRDVGLRASFWWTFLGGFIGGAWMMSVGSIAAAVSEVRKPGLDLDIVHGLRLAGDMIHPGFGAVMLTISLLGLVTVTGINFYGASLTLLSMQDSFVPVRPGIRGRLVTVLVSAVIATAIALASSHLTERIGELLAILLYLFTPWTAVNLIDFYLVRKGEYDIAAIFDPDGIYGRWNWRGLLSYAAGFAAMVPFFSTGLYTGPVAAALGGADLSMLVGLPVSAGCYLLSCRLSAPAATKAAGTACLLAGMLLCGPAARAAPKKIDLDRFDDAKRIVQLSNGERLAYVEFGPRSGQPVLLVHGYTDSARDWVPLIPYLSPRLHLIVVDLRGHGRSSKPECCYTRFDFAYDLKLLLDWFTIDRADIVGHSLGSVIAQTFAETWPEHTGKLVLISSTGGPSAHPTPDELRRRETGFDFRTSIQHLHDPIDADSAFMIDWWSSPTPVDPDFLRRQRRDAARIPARIWLAILDQGLNFTDLQADLPRLTAPALLIWGGRDPIMVPESRRTLREALPNAQLRIFPAYGHNPFWEDPAAVGGVINRFLLP